ncbi:hypothetical protein ACH4VR_36080, partial [Streptomyces sp. NPDC020883]|uniref:hypothetical protein n=1 Tax=Streptomyces sp. NPDC020883 TaxID=3365099 RepID=UPI00379F82F7
MADITGSKFTKKTRTFDVLDGAHTTRQDFTGYDFEAHGVILFVHAMLSFPLSGGGMRRRWVVRYAEDTATTKAGTFLVLRGDSIATFNEAVALAVRKAKAQQAAEDLEPDVCVECFEEVLAVDGGGLADGHHARSCS